MCPVGTVLAEIADTEEELREVGAQIVASWVEEGVRYCTSRGLTAADARATTYALLGALEGGFILARGQRTREPLVAAGRLMAASVRNLDGARR